MPSRLQSLRVTQTGGSAESQGKNSEPEPPDDGVDESPDNPPGQHEFSPSGFVLADQLDDDSAYADEEYRHQPPGAANLLLCSYLFCLCFSCGGLPCSLGSRGSSWVLRCLRWSSSSEDLIGIEDMVDPSTQFGLTLRAYEFAAVNPSLSGSSTRVISAFRLASEYRNSVAAVMSPGLSRGNGPPSIDVLSMTSRLHRRPHHHPSRHTHPSSSSPSCERKAQSPQLSR